MELKLDFGVFRPIRHQTPLHECQNTFASVAIESHDRLNAFRGNVEGGREAGTVDLVILVVEHICVVGMEPLSDLLFVRSPAVSSAHEPRLPPYCLPTRSKIIRARFTLSVTTAVRRGEGRRISGSRARRTAAMIVAAMTSVDFILVCSCICSAQTSRSRVMARFISPNSAPRFARVRGQVCARDCLGKSRMEGCFSSLRRAGTARQSLNPAWCLLVRGCSPCNSCSGLWSRCAEFAEARTRVPV